jgi:hypothetical protein
MQRGWNLIRAAILIFIMSKIKILSSLEWQASYMTFLENHSIQSYLPLKKKEIRVTNLYTNEVTIKSG